MRTALKLSVLLCAPAFAQLPETMPHHQFHPLERLTAASGAPARGVAQSYLQATAASYGLTPGDLAGAYVAKEYRTEHNGVTHFVYKQQFQGLDVYGAEWVVNVDRDGRVINAGGTLYSAPGSGVLPPDALSARAALRSALRAIRGRDPGSYVQIENEPSASPRSKRFAAAGFTDPVEGEAVWYPVNGILRPGWLFYIVDDNGVDSYATVIDDATGRMMSRQNLTLYQSEPRGLVFERESPQPSATPGTGGSDVRPYVERSLQSFAGDPQASPKGWVTGDQTAGNNVIASENPRGTTFLTPMIPTTAPAGDFSFPLTLGPGAPNPLGFADAANTNLFYWANRAHDLFYQIGFDESAGNYQQDNFARGGVGGDPMIAFSHFGASADSLATINNSFYTSRRAGEDGQAGSINMYIGGSKGVFTDGSYDAEVIVHEYTHGVSTRLVRQLGGIQGGAMGEAWSDFYSLEFTLPEASPADGAYPEGEYLLQWFGTGIRTRPYSTSMDVNPLTYSALGAVVSAPEVHADGEIWMEALWEMRANLISQFAGKEGRRRARLLVLDGMKLSPPAPTMVDMRDAILLADRVDFNGASQGQIWAAFAKRGLGVLAQSTSASSIHISASYDMPSATASMQFFDKQYVLGESVRIALQDANRTEDTALIQFTGSSGDVENLLLRRTGTVFSGSLRASASAGVTKFDGVLELIPGDSITAYYVDPKTVEGDARQIELTIATQPEYVTSIQPNATFNVPAKETALFTIPARGQLNYARVPLPFPFRLFGKTYSLAYVYGDGILTFGGTDFSPCYDRASLAMDTAIAPMWMSLAYGGDAQNSENVYMSTGADSVTFRWAAETQPYLIPFLTPGPVNFSATLYQDGRVTMQYGDGNRDLADSLVFAPSCSPMAPTVGISNGHESYTLVSLFHDSHPNLENAPGLTFLPPFNNSSVPVVQIETPAAGDHVQDLLNLRGIAYDEGGGIARLDVIVDGVPRARTFVSMSRPDFCATRNVPGCPLVGFGAPLNLTAMGIAPGNHTLTIRATNTRGTFLDFPDQPVSFVMDPGQGSLPVGAIESPADGAAISGSQTMRGYVYAPDLGISAVDVMIDGITYGSASYGQKRDDICGSLQPLPPNCPNVGFQFSLNTASGPIQLPNGVHTLQVRARDAAGRVKLIPETPLKINVDNAAAEPPTGVLTSPQPGATVSGRIAISGYAWSPGGKVRTTVVLIDGASISSLRYGAARPEECAGLADVAACPNIGFDGTLDTTLVPNGPHVLGVGLIDDQGHTAVIPSTLRYGMNVVVKNE